jgi:CubicO group peptidase (beta-lactamase class C family)
MERVGVPGLSLALVREATVVASQAFGTKDTRTAEAVNTETVFQAASLSKPVFAYAVLRMVERGAIDLDASLASYLPQPYVSDDPLLGRITARIVLCHTTGWPNWRPEGQPLRREREPGEAFGYSGEGYNYLQRAVEQILGQPLDSYMRATVFAPLGMIRSTYRWAEPDHPGVASAHDGARQPHEPGHWTEPEAASSLHTTPGDLARFLCAMLSPGSGPGSLQEQTLQDMLRPQITLTHGVAWGLGWGLENLGGETAMWHWGDNRGYKSFMLALPRQRVGLVVMTNGDNGLALWQPIVEMTLGGDHAAFRWLADQYDVPDLARAASHPPSGDTGTADE